MAIAAEAVLEQPDVDTIQCHYCHLIEREVASLHFELGAQMIRSEDAELSSNLASSFWFMDKTTPSHYTSMEVDYTQE